MGLLDLFSSGSGEAAAGRELQAQKKAFQSGKRFTKQGYGEAITEQNKALTPFENLMGQAAPGVRAYFGGLGVPGIEGGGGTFSGGGATGDWVDEAQNAWKNSIPYQEYSALLPDIYETSLRRGGVTGQTGNIPIDLSNRTMQALNQFYPGWQANLARAIQMQEFGATGGANVHGDIANLLTGRANTLTGLAENKAGDIGNYYRQVEGAKGAAGKNTLDALFAAAGLAMAPFTGGASLGTSLKSLAGIGGEGGGATASGALSNLFGTSPNDYGMYESSPGVWSDAFSNPATGTYL